MQRRFFFFKNCLIQCNVLSFEGYIDSECDGMNSIFWQDLTRIIGHWLIWNDRSQDYAMPIRCVSFRHRHVPSCWICILIALAMFSVYLNKQRTTEQCLFIAKSRVARAQTESACISTVGSDGTNMCRTDALSIRTEAFVSLKVF